MRRLLLAAVAVAVFAVPARAELKPHGLFTDHAVLQRAKPIPVWGAATPGAEVMVSFRDAKVSGKADDKGQWKVELPPQRVGGPDVLTITGDGKTITLNDILVGEVWVCSGQSNMGWRINQSADAKQHTEAANHPKLRLFQVKLTASAKPLHDVPVDRDWATWHACTPEIIGKYSAVAYFFGRDLHRDLNVPIGLIHTSWGGTPAQSWTSEEALNSEPTLQYYHEQMKKALAGWDPEKSKADYEKARAKHKDDAAKAKAEGKTPPRAPGMPTAPDAGSHSTSALFNGMIHPLLPYRIAGAIWYQGESNANKSIEYRTLFPAMIKNWRARWGQGDFPFLCVQLAPFNAGNPEGVNWAELREAQWLACKVLPNVGMAVITDVGEKNDIHPPRKEPVGSRLALLAQAIAYRKDIVANGPQYKAMKVEGNRAILSFDSVGAGLETREGELKGFAVCGADKMFKPAKAEIRGDTVIVWADGVDQPVAVRFGWKNYPEVNLFNKNGLPATPFRTDDFPLTTERTR